MSSKKRSLFSKLWRACKSALHVNQFEKMLRTAKDPTRIYVVWNRGMGDVPLGLYGVNARIRQFFPTIDIVYLTREDLLDVFAMLPGCRAEALPGLKRGSHYDVSAYAKRGLLFEGLDPTRDLPWLPGTIVPRLYLPGDAVALSARFGLEGKQYVGMHIDTETGHFYGYEKNWPHEKWDALIQQLRVAGVTPLLFGQRKTGHYEGAIDLRGETTLHELCAILLTHCHTLVAPDSGILSTIYYVEHTKPLHVISLWNDPRQGVLRQGVPSPNRALTHTPLFGLATISPDDIYSQIQTVNVQEIG